MTTTVKIAEAMVWTGSAGKLDASCGPDPEPRKTNLLLR